MVTAVNDFDTTLQAEPQRTLAPRGGIILSTTANVVTVNGNVGTPSVITLVATPLTAFGPIKFTASPTVPLSIDATGKIATLRYADMGTSSVVVTAEMTAAGITYTDSKTISSVSFGSLGYQGALDATRNNTAQGPAASRPAGNNGDFYFATDTLVLYQKVNGAWQAAGNNYTSTSQLYDGAGLGETAQWVLLDGKPVDNDILNSVLTPSIIAAQTAADAANEKADAISADGTLDRSEKAQLVTDWLAVDADWAAIRGRAGSLGLSYAAYDTCHTNTSNYLLSLRPNWDDTSKDTLIDRGTYRESFRQLFLAKAALQSQIDAKAATMANADGFTGTVGGDNLAPNSSFENWSASTNMAVGYTVYNNANSAEPTIAVDAGANSGRNGSGRAQMIQWTGNHTDTKGICGLMCPGGWQVGKTYIVSFYAKTTNLSSVGGMYLGWNNPPPTTTLMNPNLSPSWQRYAFRFTIVAFPQPDGQGYLSVHNGAGSGNVYFDDLMVVEGDVLPAYYPSTAEASAAAAAAQNDADAAKLRLDSISADDKLDRSEKPDVEQRWATIAAERNDIVNKAAMLGANSGNYVATWDALNYYLGSLPGWLDHTVDTLIVRVDFDKKFNDYYTERQALLNAFAIRNKVLTDAAATTADWIKVGGRPSDDQIKNNMADLSGWYRLAPLPWNQNGEFNVLGNSVADYNIPGPKGVDDTVWRAEEKGWNQDASSNGPGGGWNSAPVHLDPTKKYRFVIPIYRVQGTGSAYWGTNGVATINTTTLSPDNNPYFASSGSLVLGRWYLFIGYIFPAGSTGNTHDGSGIWDCSTGAQVLVGSNYNFMPGVGDIVHRAYQYYADIGSIQLFSRPMINLVDGTEPSLREYFSAAALLNSSNTLGPDGKLNGGLGGQVTLPGMGQNTFRIFAKGNQAYSAPTTAPGFYMNGVLNTASSAHRSYTLITISRATLAVGVSNYDVYGAGETEGGRGAAQLAADLNWCADRPGQYVVVVLTHDEPWNNRMTAGLPAAMYRNGASRNIFGSSEFKEWSAYALIGISGIGEGGGKQAYQGAVRSDTNSWIDVSFTMLGGDVTGASADYTPKTLQDYGFTGAMNATYGATLGTNVSGSINDSNAAGLVTVTSLRVMAPKIGSYSTAASGGQMDLADSGIKIYDGIGALRVRIGNLSV